MQNEETVTVQSWCETLPPAGSLVIVRNSGYRVCSVYIDIEDLYRLPSDIAHAEVKEWSYGHISIVDPYGQFHPVPCLYVDIEK